MRLPMPLSSARTAAASPPWPIITSCGPDLLGAGALAMLPRDLAWAAYWYEAPTDGRDGRGFLVAEFVDGVYGTVALTQPVGHRYPPRRRLYFSR